MTFDLQKQVQRRHLEEWIRDPSNAEAVEFVRARHRGALHKIRRDLASMHRVFCYERFGGREWMHVLIAFGRLDDEILEVVNEAGRSRYQEHKAKKGDRWLEEDEVERRRASAPPRGRVCGVQHSKSHAKLLREAAKREQKKLDKATSDWNAGRSCMSNSAWRALERRVAELWREAEIASDEAGRPYVGRDGEWSALGQVDDSLVGRAIAIYRAKRSKASAASRGPP